MYLPWVTVNKKLLEAVQVVNKIPTSLFRQILSGDSPELITDFKMSEEQKQLVVNGITYLLNKSCIFILSPSVLYKDLTDVLGMEQHKAEEFVSAWTKKTQDEFGDLDVRKKLDDVTWQINWDFTPDSDDSDYTARLQLSLSDLTGGQQEVKTMECTRDDLQVLYDTLESVPKTIDSIKK